MKKILTVLFSFLLILTSISAVVADTESITLSEVSGSESVVNVKGETDGVDIIAIQIVDKEDHNTIYAMETTDVVDGKFDVDIEVNLKANTEYTVLIANFNSGKYTAKNFVTTKDLFKFDTISATLDSEIGLNFYTIIDDSIKQESYMEFKVNGNNNPITTRIDTSDGIKEDDGRYKFTCDVNTLRVAEEIEATFHFGDDKTATKKISVMDYLNRLLDIYKDNVDGKEYRLVNSVIEYTHYAQLLLADTNGYTIGDNGFAPIEYYGEEPNKDVNLDEFKYIKEGSVDGVSLSSLSLNLESKINLNVYVNSNEEPVVNVKDFNRKDVNCTVEKANASQYKITISGITPKQLGNYYTFNITKTGAESSITLSVSVLSYARMALSSSKNTDVQKNLAAALYDYYVCTMNY